MIVLGKRVIGEQAAAEAREKAQNSAGGGAIRLGKRLLSRMPGRDENGRVKLLAVSANRTPERPGAPVGPLRTENTPRPATAKSQKRAKANTDTPAADSAAPAVELYDVGQVEALLTENPNDWAKVVDAEAARPEGPRPEIAALVLAVAELATTNPVPEEVLAALEKIAPEKPLTDPNFTPTVAKP